VQRSRASVAERLDQPGVPPAEAERALRDLDRVYRWLLFGAPLRRAVLDALARSAGSGGGRIWAVDIGAGGGHVADDLVAAARRRGRRLSVIGVDAKLSHLLAGRRMESPQLPVVADAQALPFAGGAVTCALSHLFFHHLDDAANRAVLEEMCRVARHVVVVDLRRSRLSRLLVRPCLRLLALSPTAYHDGVASVHGSYRLEEVAAVVEGLPVRELRARFPFRWSLVIAGSEA
jgi:ubiquinone/menaquinone biosynthesis C-methylase UbiE